MRSFAAFSTDRCVLSNTGLQAGGRRTRRAQAVSTVYEGIRREKNARSQTLAVGGLEIAAP
jgi:hypothetical protein